MIQISTGKCFRHLLLGTVLAVSLSACETSKDILDTANPMNWFDGDEEADAGPVPGEDSEYPNIGAVPDTPVEPAIKREYQQLQSGLVADSQNARYSDQQVRSQEIPEKLSKTEARALPVPAKISQPPVAASSGTDVEPTVSVDDSGRLVSLAAPDPSTGKFQPVPTQPAPSTLAAAPKPAIPAKPAPAPAPLNTQTIVPKPAAPVPSAAPVAQSPAAPQQVAARPAAPAAAPAPAPTAAAGKESIVARIFFADGSAALSVQDRGVVSQVVGIFRRGGKALKISGHSSSASGTQDPMRASLVNFKMSMDRANAVASELLRLGVAKEQILVEARGSKEPLYDENSATGEAGNRRAEIYIVY